MSHVFLYLAFGQNGGLVLKGRYTRNIASTSSTIEEKDSGDIYIKTVNRGNQRNGLNNRWLKNACLLPCPDTTCLKQRCCIPKDVKETDARMIEEM